MEQNYAGFKVVKMLCGQNNIDYSMVDLRMLCINLIEGSEITSTYISTELLCGHATVTTSRLLLKGDFKCHDDV
ncbi:hypothetical protein AV530_017376 [Patagioenas fasciata monilis]|uniref:Uncharacterized protein n=1 Tax=Patagioenas fasciata monilis TaxID=372326 RepID=A0A1V4JFZ4_PATFA|nr:hypothetical protein AV530_017376 [Patagioenas fasciata monilis]